MDPVWYPLDLADCTLEPPARRGGVESSHDSPLEGDGFELPVREHGATHFAMGGPHRGGPHGSPLRLGTRSRQWEAGAPRSAASRWEAAANPWLGAIARCQAARYRAARRAAMRSAHCEIRPGENVTLLYLSHDGSPGPPPCEPPPPCGPMASASQSPL